MNLKALSYKLRQDTVDLIRAGKAGHIGGDMSVMEILTELYFDQMNISPENMDSPDRDYFVMSKGHSVEAYYSVLAEKGFFPKEELHKTFSKFGSRFIGHPNNKRERFPWEDVICRGRRGEEGESSLWGRESPLSPLQDDDIRFQYPDSG